MIVIEADSPIAGGEAPTVVARLAERLERVDGVARVRTGPPEAERRFIEDFLPDNVLLYVDPDTLKVVAEGFRPEAIRAALLDGGPRDPLNLGRLAVGAQQRWQPGSRVQLQDGLYTLPDRRTVFLEVETVEPRQDIEATRSLIRSIDAILAEARSDAAPGDASQDVRYSAVGYSVSVASVFTEIFGDVVRVAAAATVVVVLLLWVFFRRLAAPMMLLATVGIGVLAAAGAAAVLLGSVSLATWIFGVLLLGLGVDFGIHIAVHYWLCGRPARSRVEALARAIHRPGRGIIVAGLTTSAALASVGLLPSPVTREVAVFTTVGLVSIMISSFVVLPLLLSFSDPAERFQRSWMRWTALWVKTHRLPVILATGPWALVLVSGLAVAGTLPVDYLQWYAMVRSDPHSPALEALIDDTGIAFPPVVMLSSGSTTEQALGRDREAVRRVLDIGLRGNVSAVQSLSRWLPAEDDQRANLGFIRTNPDLFSPERFRHAFLASLEAAGRDPYLESEYMPRVVRALGPRTELITLDRLRAMGLGETVDRHLAVDGDSSLVASFIYLRQLPWADGVAARFVAEAQRAGLYGLPGVTVQDSWLRPDDHEQMLRKAAVVATVVALVLVGGILAFRFRRPSVIILCFVPLACAVSVAALVMRFLGIELSLMSITIAPILAGISVDDGIHMVDRLSDGQPLTTVLGETGSSMTMTTLTTVGAFACLGLASTPGIRELGIVGAAGLVAALVASLQLVPVGWRWIDRHPESIPAGSSAP